jgi:hypothetical protein
MKAPLLMTGLRPRASAPLGGRVGPRFCRLLVAPSRTPRLVASRPRVPARSAAARSADFSRFRIGTVSRISNPLRVRNTPRCNPRRGFRRAARQDFINSLVTG